VHLEISFAEIMTVEIRNFTVNFLREEVCGRSRSLTNLWSQSKYTSAAITTFQSQSPGGVLTVDIVSPRARLISMHSRGSAIGECCQSAPLPKSPYESQGSQEMILSGRSDPNTAFSSCFQSAPALKTLADKLKAVPEQHVARGNGPESLSQGRILFAARQSKISVQKPVSFP